MVSVIGFTGALAGLLRAPTGASGSFADPAMEQTSAKTPVDSHVATRIVVSFVIADRVPGYSCTGSPDSGVGNQGPWLIQVEFPPARERVATSRALFATTVVLQAWHRAARMACCVLATLQMALSVVLAAEPEANAPGLHRDVVFSEYSPLASSAELMRRLLSPLAAWQVKESVAHGGEALREQEVNLAEEHFALYVPAHAPSQGYGLLVFVAPWQGAALPRGWDSVLERYDIVFVSAANSGNDANVLGRREPLAVLAATNVMRRLKIDPQRVYIGGFSGGSRVALRL